MKAMSFLLPLTLLFILHCHWPSLHGREYFNYSRPGRLWLATSRVGTGKTISFFTVYAANLGCPIMLHSAKNTSDRGTVLEQDKYMFSVNMYSIQCKNESYYACMLFEEAYIRPHGQFCYTAVEDMAVHFISILVLCTKTYLAAAFCEGLWRVGGGGILLNFANFLCKTGRHMIGCPLHILTVVWGRAVLSVVLGWCRALLLFSQIDTEHVWKRDVEQWFL